MALKHSRQRDAIYSFLEGRKDHPTADVIYMGVRESYPNISLGTVYRNLMVLRDAGKVRTVNVGDGIVHFDSDTSDHNHFVCEKCGCVRDIEMPELGGLTETAAEHFHGKIRGCSVYFYGVCENCLEAERAAGNADLQSRRQ